MIHSTTTIDGVIILTLPQFIDSRGSFTKTFHDDTFQQLGIDFKLKESYFSISKKDVIRGMHFQTPPHDHEKIVFCPQGKIVDVIVDIRKNSPTYGQFVSIELSSDNHQAVFIPKGCAHGFKSLEDNTITYYLLSSVHAPESDSGILYNSFGMEWNCEHPILSERDLSFVKLEDFKSPF